MKPNTKTAIETREHVEKPWDYEGETRKIYSGQDVSEIIRNAEEATEAATITDFVRTFLNLNTDANAALDLFAAAASFRYDVKPKA